MGWSDAPLTSLTLPQDAASSDPRIVIGPDIPAALAAYGAPNQTWNAAILWYFNATDFYFIATGHQVNPGPTPDWDFVAKGTYRAPPLEGVTIHELLTTDAVPGTVYGDATTFLTFLYQNASIDLESSSRLVMPPGNSLGWQNQAIGYRTAGFTQTAGAETAVPAGSWAVEPSFTAVTDHIYLFRWSGQIGASAAGGMYGTMRVRIGSATVAGTVVATTYTDAPTNLWSPTRSGWGYGRYTGAGAILKASLTIQKNAGAAGNILVDSDVNSPVRVEIDDTADFNYSVGQYVAAIAVPFT